MCSAACAVWEGTTVDLTTPVTMDQVVKERERKERVGRGRNGQTTSLDEIEPLEPQRASTQHIALSLSLSHPPTLTALTTHTTPLTTLLPTTAAAAATTLLLH